jgi:hypothetical protein
MIRIKPKSYGLRSLQWRWWSKTNKNRQGKNRFQTKIFLNMAQTPPSKSC